MEWHFERNARMTRRARRLGAVLSNGSLKDGFPKLSLGGHKLPTRSGEYVRIFLSEDAAA
jgi:hypothetical protein